jgi:hypothetical protein
MEKGAERPSMFAAYLERIVETNSFLRKENPPFPPIDELLKADRVNDMSMVRCCK